LSSNATSRGQAGASGTTSAAAAISAAKAAQILEQLSESPGFLISARSSLVNLESLLSVIEAALSAHGRTGASRSTAITAGCLSSLLDSLSTACHDATIRRDILQKRQPLLAALADCLVRHAPLLPDPQHTRLVTAACQLLHNICVGQLNDLTTARADPNSLASCIASSGRLPDLLLAGVGAVLDQPSHGPELRAVVVALAGRLLPLCSSQRSSNLSALLYLFSPRQNTNSSVPSGLGSKNKPVTDFARKDAGDAVPKADIESDHLTSHLLGGCIRCLAAGVTHSVSLRYAIGDDRRRVRRLARMLRAKIPSTPAVSSTSTSNVFSAPTEPRDEVLAGNACLILQHCTDDTPLAEHLQGTSVILDLLKLIQESQRSDTKRNAAIVIGKLAQSSHVHRDELSRLDGWSVLKSFSSWSSPFAGW
uniref:Armadillo repeat-containing protein 8 n=1 Tax=Echinostoma caproni TaxID=27848 RepID=A0A183AIN3_9TREM